MEEKNGLKSSEYKEEAAPAAGTDTAGGAEAAAGTEGSFGTDPAAGITETAAPGTEPEAASDAGDSNAQAQDTGWKQGPYAGPETPAGGQNAAGAPAEPNDNPYGQNPYGQPQNQGYNPYDQNPYGQPQNQGYDQYHQNPYGQPQNQAYNPYGQNPYGQPQNQAYNPYGQNSCGQPQNPNDNPYGQYPYGQSPYGQPQNQGYNPYGQPQNQGYNPYTQDPYGQKPPKQKNVYATVSLIAGICGLVSLCGCMFPVAILLGVGAVIFAFLSKKADGRLRGTAIAGVILGALCVLLGVGEFYYLMTLQRMMQDPDVARALQEFYDQVGAMR